MKDTRSAKALFIAWLARENPRVYERVVATAQQKLREAKLAGLGNLSGWLDTLVTAAVAVGGTLVAKKQADKAASLQRQQAEADLKIVLLNVNAQRAASGQPPVDINGNVIPGAVLPVPATLKSILPGAQTAPENYTPWLIGGGVAVAAVLLVMRGR